MPETHAVIDEIVKCTLRSSKPDNASSAAFHSAAEFRIAVKAKNNEKYNVEVNGERNCVRQSVLFNPVNFRSSKIIFIKNMRFYLKKKKKEKAARDNENA